LTAAIGAFGSDSAWHSVKKISCAKREKEKAQTLKSIDDIEQEAPIMQTQEPSSHHQIFSTHLFIMQDGNAMMVTQCLREVRSIKKLN
jgi:hypothetical protein